MSKMLFLTAAMLCAIACVVALYHDKMLLGFTDALCVIVAYICFMQIDERR